MFMKSKTRIQWPWFIGLFCLAAMANTYRTDLWLCVSSTESAGEARVEGNAFSDRSGSLRAATLRQVGVRALWQGLLLWAIVALGSLLLIVHGWIWL